MFFFCCYRNAASSEHSIYPQDFMDALMPYTPPDKAGFFESSHILLIQCVTWNTEPSKLETAPFHDVEANLRAAAWARIDNRDELAGKLGISPQLASQLCDTDLICRCYRKWEENCVEHLIGDFVFVIYDEKKRQIFCGRDHMGVKPFYYHLSGSCFACATSLAPLIRLKDISIHISRKWIADYLTDLSMSFTETPYREISKLPPAHTLTVTPETHRLRQYFELSAEPELRLKDSREYVDAYREQFETAVKCRINTVYPLGSELSGGLDSSSITAYAAKFFPWPLSRLHAFAFTDMEMEPQYILAVSQAYQLPHTHVVAGWDRDEPLAVRERSLRILGYPVEHANATFHEPFYRLAEKFGVRTLLSGFGGDEFGTTLYGYMARMELLLEHRYIDLLNILPGKSPFRFLRFVKLVLRKIKTHDFTQPTCNPIFLAAWNQRWPHQIVAEEAVRAYDLKRRYFEIARFDAGYTDLKRFTLEKRWGPFVPTRMENCTLMAAAQKIDYRWPLLDVRLVKLWLSIPSAENYFRGMGRYLHRRAVDGVVPEMVAWKTDKCMGNIVGRRNHDGKQMHVPADFIENLHPALKDMMDVERFIKQADDFTSCSASNHDGLAFQFLHNLRAVEELDHWLKQADASGSYFSLY